jgi:aldose 1-epimerase
VTRLAAAGWSLRILPEQGAAFAWLRHGERDVLAPVPEGADPNTARAGAFWMLPWTNRLDAGRLAVDGVEHRLAITHAAENNALHGFARDLPWRVVEHGAGHAVLEQHAARGPFDYAARLAVGLGEAGLTLALEVRHDGGAPCPYGLGWHPWFVRPAATRLAFHAGQRFRRDARNLPVGTEASEGVAGEAAAWVGADTHHAGWDGVARLDLAGLALTLRAEGAWARNLQLYAPADKAVLCVEPVSHVPDVANRRQFAALGDMAVLGRGQALSARLVLSAD